MGRNSILSVDVIPGHSASDVVVGQGDDQAGLAVPGSHHTRSGHTLGQVVFVFRGIGQAVSAHHFTNSRRRNGVAGGVPRHLQHRPVEITGGETDAGVCGFIGSAVAAQGRKTHRLRGDGRQGGVECARCRCRGDHVVLRPDGDGKGLHVDGGRSIGVFDSELEEGKLRHRLGADLQAGRRSVDGARPYANVQVGIERAVLGGEEHSGILYSGMVIPGGRGRIDQRAGGTVGSAAFYGEADGGRTALAVHGVHVGLGHILGLVYLIEDGNLLVLCPGGGDFIVSVVGHGFCRRSLSGQRGGYGDAFRRFFRLKIRFGFVAAGECQQHGEHSNYFSHRNVLLKCNRFKRICAFYIVRRICQTLADNALSFDVQNPHPGSFVELLKFCFHSIKPSLFYFLKFFKFKKMIINIQDPRNLITDKADAATSILGGLLGRKK